MAASMLETIGLPELVSRTSEEYLSIALELASNPEKLREIKTRLTENIVSSPIFNPALFANHIEQAYRISFERYQKSSPLEDIFIEA
jgi:predicted O-linked N-acetylglucosamine transferase (SPINDLY family)